MASDIVHDTEETTYAGIPSQQGNDYVVVDLAPAVLRILNDRSAAGLKTVLGDTPSASQDYILPGDHIVVTIWEIGVNMNGVFLNSGTSTAPPDTSSTTAAGQLPPQSVTVPEQIVAPDGTVFVPYVGRLDIAGLDTAAVQDRIRQRLEGKAVEPQVMVTLVQHPSSQVTILGDVVKGAQVPLTQNSKRVLDVIAAVGGVAIPSTDVQVQVVRANKTAATSLQAIMDNPSENVALRPNDTIVVSKAPKFFTVLGATGRNGRIQFEANQLSLADSLGLAGGLLDDRADPKGIFVFRYEPETVARQICGTCGHVGDKGLVPIVYRLDVSNAESLFMTQSFQIADRDVLYVANAPRVELQKFLAMLRDLTSPILTGAVVSNAVKQ